jgi:hypothetical protein
MIQGIMSPEPILAHRLDHIILETDDIRRDHKQLLQRGYPEAWPIGPFWPYALTSGIHVGRFNLEFVEPLNRATDPNRLVLVFEPAESVDTNGWQEKIEPNPALLRLRGFDREGLDKPQLICRNSPVFEQPIPHFFCDYMPALRQRLHPSKFTLFAGLELAQFTLCANAIPEHLIVPEIIWQEKSPIDNPTGDVRHFLRL